jgi:hydrogenase maturation protease
MTTSTTRCLILSCGNTLRSDDGIGPFLSEWAREHYAGDPGIVVITRHQWTPDLAVDLAEAETALFIDCAVDLEPGEIRLKEVTPAGEEKVLNTHHIGAPELLGLTRAFCAAVPRRTFLLTIGAGSIELGEQFSPVVEQAIPAAQKRLEEAVASLTRPR